MVRNLKMWSLVGAALVLSLLVFLLPAFLSLTLPMALLVAVLIVSGRMADIRAANDLHVAMRLRPIAQSPEYRIHIFRIDILIDCDHDLRH